MNHLIGPLNSSSSPALGRIARDTIGGENVIARPSLSSGLGALIRKERDLQSVTEDNAGLDHGLHSTDVAGILREHYRRLGANIAILEQRYEPLPAGSRVGAVKTAPQPPPSAGGKSLVPAARGGVRELIGHHECLIRSAEKLIADGSGGQRGALILREVVQNHEEMAWTLTALVRDGLATYQVMPFPADADRGTTAPAASAL